MVQPDEAFSRTNEEANETSERLQRIVEDAVSRGDRTLSILETTHEARLEVDA
jgi:hypothetical protein